MDCDFNCGDGCGDGCGDDGGRSGGRGCWWNLLSGCDACDLLPDRKEREKRERRRRRPEHPHGTAHTDGVAPADGIAHARGAVRADGVAGTAWGPASAASAAFVAAELVDRMALAGPPAGVVPRASLRWWSVSRLVGVAAIRLYQRTISPRLPTRCRYTPTCSAYGLQAVRAYGLVTGSRLALGRIRRCRHHVPYGTRDPLFVREFGSTARARGRFQTWWTGVLSAG